LARSAPASRRFSACDLPIVAKLAALLGCTRKSCDGKHLHQALPRHTANGSSPAPRSGGAAVLKRPHPPLHNLNRPSVALVLAPVGYVAAQLNTLGLQHPVDNPLQPFLPEIELLLAIPNKLAMVYILRTGDVGATRALAFSVASSNQLFRFDICQIKPSFLMESNSIACSQGPSQALSSALLR
jgi:hypothetical protein